MQKYFKPALYFFIAFLASFLVYSSFPRSSLLVSDQPKGASVKIQEARLAKDGFITVFAPSSEAFYIPEGILGVTEYLPAGRYKDINIFLTADASTIPDDILVTMFFDDGDGILHPDIDKGTEIKFVKLY